MKDLSATEAARRLSDVLDAVEHRGESFSIVRRGRPVARLIPVARSSGRDLKELLARHRVDTGWADELTALRACQVHEDRRRRPRAP